MAKDFAVITIHGMGDTKIDYYKSFEKNLGIGSARMLGMQRSIWSMYITKTCYKANRKIIMRTVTTNTISGGTFCVN